MFALTKVYGIDKKQSFIICKKLGLSTNCKVIELSHDQTNELVKLFENSNLVLSNDLKKLQVLFLKKLIKL